MRLSCPHCNRTREHVRSDFFGDWVVCPVCELPFAWREARAEDSDGSPPQNGRRVKEVERTATREEER